MLKDRQIQILMAMHTLEKSIGELYSLFAEKFPGHSDLWKRLSEDEQGHAEAVRKLYQISYDGQSVFAEENIKPEAVQSIIDYVKEIHASATLGKLSAQKALGITYDLENSLLEKTIFQHFKATSQFVNILQVLRKQTKEHAVMTKTEMETSPQADMQRKAG